MPLRQNVDGVLLDIRLTPNAAQNRIDGILVDGEGRPRLKVKVTAIAEKGKANSAVIKLLSKSIKCGRGNFEIVSGKLDRNKTLLIRGEPSEMENQLNAWLEQFYPA
ncbi:DUF167 family protein [uncultured Sneathiella sp.]|uniref:DUF167 family protein n=1 Tax=uncultured Sneathiella sp. TaxID=879315 RepID=UPI0025987A58|nr:DUF167 family protein [uncultured Sneathiella sp.]